MGAWGRALSWALAGGFFLVAMWGLVQLINWGSSWRI